MATDIALLSDMLAVLANLGDHALPAANIGRETEIRHGRPLVQQQIDDLLTMGVQNGWVAKRKDVFKRDVFFITPEGIAAREAI